MQQETPKKLNKKSPRNTHGFIIYFERAETISALFWQKAATPDSFDVKFLFILLRFSTKGFENSLERGNAALFSFPKRKKFQKRSWRACRSSAFCFGKKSPWGSARKPAHSCGTVRLARGVLRRPRFFWELSSNRDFALRAGCLCPTSDSPNPWFHPHQAKQEGLYVYFPTEFMQINSCLEVCMS